MSKKNKYFLILVVFFTAAINILGQVPLVQV